MKQKIKERDNRYDQEIKAINKGKKKDSRKPTFN